MSETKGPDQISERLRHAAHEADERARLLHDAAATLERHVGYVVELTEERNGLRAAMAATSRDHRQRATIKWVRSTFGEAAALPAERALRLLEETVELVQAVGIDRDRVLAIVNHVYGKPPGEPAQEVGGIGVTLLAYCASTGISADAEEARELDRVLAVDPAYFRARHNAKADAGIAVRAPEDGEG